MDFSRIALYIVVLVLVTILFNIGAWFSLVKLIDRMGAGLAFHRFVGIRHLRGRRSGSLTIIGLLCIIAVSFSSCTLTSVLSVMGGFSGDLKQKILDTNAHIVVDNYGGHMDGVPTPNVKTDAPDPLSERLSDWRSLLAYLEEKPYVKAAAPMVQGEVMVNAKSNNSGMLLKGVRTQQLAKISTVLHHLEDGDVAYIEAPEKLFEKVRSRQRGTRKLFPDSDAVLDAPDTAGDTDDPSLFIPAPRFSGQRVLPALIVGKEIANSLRLYVGEEVKIISPLGEIGPTGRIPKSRPFRVGGSFYSGMYTFDEHYAYTSLEAAQTFLNTGDAISEIHIVIDNPDRAGRVARQLERDLEGRLRVRSWQELNAKLFSALKLEKIVMFLLMSIAIAIASFSIVATLTMLVLEKGPEISVLMTIGATPSDVKRIFRYEGVVIGGIGSFTGLVVGYLLCLSLQRIGLPIPPESFYIDKLPVTISPWEFLAVGGTCFVLTMLATIYPADVASRIKPVEGLK